MHNKEKQTEYFFYIFVFLGIVAVFYSEPFMRYPYDVFAHLIAIDDLYYGREVSSQIPTARLVWHQMWADIFTFFHLGSLDFLYRAKIIHVTQIIISFFAMYYFAYIIFRNLFKNTARIVLKYLSFWSVLIWLTIFATFSIKYQMVWTLWYSVNYQISLPLFWYITALSIVLLFEDTSKIKKIFFSIQIIVISWFILQIHAMEFMYYLMHLSILGIVYFRDIYRYIKKYYYRVSLLIIVMVLSIKAVLRDEFGFVKYLQESHDTLYGLILSAGETVVSRYNRSNYAINELMYVILALGTLTFLWIIWRWYRKDNDINYRLFLYILLSSMFIFIPLWAPSAGIFALITKTTVVHRIYFSSSLFLLLPLSVYYLYSYFKSKLFFINLTIAVILLSTYTYSKSTQHKIYYKNVESILNSFNGSYHFHFSKKDIDTIGNMINQFKYFNPTDKEIMYFARQDIAFVLKYIFHQRKVYWRGRRDFIDYKEAYKKHLIYDKYHKIVIPDNKLLPPLRAYQ